MPMSPQDRKTFMAAAQDSPQAAMAAIANSLYETREIQADMLNAWTDFQKAHASGGGGQGLAELRAEVQDMAQHVAMMQNEGVSIRGSFSGPSIGSRAASKLEEDPTFQAASSTAQNRMQVGDFSCRVNVTGGIQAALVNENGNANPSTDGSFPAQPERSGVFGPVLPTLRLLDALPKRPTSNNSVEFVQVSATGDAGVQAGEGTEKANVDFEGELAQAMIATIAAHTTASTQVLADTPALQQIIDRVLQTKCLSKLEGELMYGSGVGSNIGGLMVQAPTMTPTIGTTTADIYGEALVRLADADYSPNLAVMHPLDWYRLLLTRKNNTDEEYVFGSPTLPIPPALWNTRIVLTNKINQGSGLVLDTRYTTVLDREQVSVVISRSHKDYMTKNLVLILAELRAGLEVTDQNALRKFTLPAVSA